MNYARPLKNFTKAKTTDVSKFDNFLVAITLFFLLIFLVWPHSSGIISFADNLKFKTEFQSVDISKHGGSTQVVTKKQNQNYLITRQLNLTDYIPITPPYKLPPAIYQNPDLESTVCVNGSYNCVDFPEVSKIPSKLANIKFSTYSKIINDLNKHTNPQVGIYVFSENSTHIKMIIHPKDSKGNPKPYLGDYWIARVVPQSENKGYVLKQTSNVNFGTFIPLEIHEITDKNIYEISLSKSHPLFQKNNTGSKTFTLQLFFIRTSEMASLHRRLQTKMGSSNRVWSAQFENTPQQAPCSPLAPFLLKDFYDENTICKIVDKPGREFYCKVEDSKTCENKILKIGFKDIGQADEFSSEEAPSKRTGDLISNFNPDRFYENLVRYDDFDVVESSNGGGVFDSNFESYWDDKIFKDPKVPEMTDSDKRESVLKNKIFVSIGDSINYQIVEDLVQVAENCQRQNWNFLDLKNDPAICGDVSSENDRYAPQKYYCENLNLTIYHIWHGHPLHQLHCPLTQHNGGEILEKMVEHKWFGEEYIIFTDIGVHLAIFNPIVVYRRLVDFRKSAERYLEASFENNKKPAKIVYKGMTFNRGDMKETYGTVSSTIMMRIQEIADYVFEGSCVRVFEFYKLTESVHSVSKPKKTAQ